MMDVSSQLSQASQLIKEKKLEEAKPILKQVLAEDKRNVAAWVLFGDSMSDKRVAIECYKKAIAIDPTYKPALQRHDSLKIEFANSDLKADIKAKNSMDGEKIGLGKALGVAHASFFDMKIPVGFVIALTAILLFFAFAPTRPPYILVLGFLFFVALIAFLAWIIFRMGNELIVWENGIVQKWYGGNTRVWMWTAFHDVEHKMHTINYMNRRGNIYKVEKRLHVKLFSEQGNLVVDWRYDNHIPYGYYAVDCVQNKGKPRQSLENYLRANPMNY